MHAGVQVSIRRTHEHFSIRSVLRFLESNRTMASSSHTHASMSTTTEIIAESERAFPADEGCPSEVGAQPSDPPPKYFEENGLRFRIPSDGRDDYTHRRMYDLSVTPPQYGFFFLDPIRRNCYGEPDPNQGPLRSKEEVQRKREERRRKREAKRKRRDAPGERIYIPDIEPDEQGLVMGLPYSYGYLIDPPPTFDINTKLRKRRPQRPPPLEPELNSEPEYEPILFERSSDEEEDDRLEEERIEKQTFEQFLQDDWQPDSDLAMYHPYIQDNWHINIDEETYRQCLAPFGKDDFEEESLLDDEASKEERGVTKDIKKRRLNDGQSIGSKVLSIAWSISKRVLKLLTSRMSS